MITMTNPRLVGVDVHRTTTTVCWMDRQGREVAPRTTLANTHPGTEAFVHQVAQRVLDGDYDASSIATEATDYSWWHFFQTLDQALRLQSGPVSLDPLNPRLTASFTTT